MMRKVLYLFSKTPDRFPAELLVPSSAEHEVSVVLAQDAVALRGVPASQVYAVSEDVRSRGGSSPFPAISSQDLLRMMFEADTVVAL